MNETAQPLRYRGTQSNYADIAIRGTDEHLGIGVDYAIHGKDGAGYFIVRFVAHGKDVNPKNYKHLMFRESAKFLKGGEAAHAELFVGVRLNKVAIKVFTPAVKAWEVGAFADKFSVWPLLTEWVAEQVLAEGFTVTVQLQQVLSSLVVEQPTEGDVTCVIAFPDLKSAEAQASALKQVQKPAPDDEDSENDGDDEDGDDDDKPWMN